ncbi:MAG: hypothetical protein L6Q71_07425 [Planctomycetes bacterium]|nr:hypothetical protein [Planctomycetota bacterium]
MKQVLMFGVVMLALCFAGCGGSAGDSGERAMAKDVLEAFAEGDVLEIFEKFTPEQQQATLLGFDSNVQWMTTLSEADRETAIKEKVNDVMWWDKDWTRVDNIEKLSSFDRDSKIRFELARFREYASPERTKKKFKEQMDDMRLVGYTRGFDGSMGDWGIASVAFQNKWGAGLNISLIQREGRWYVTSLTPIGFEFRTKEETEAARKAS